MTAARRIGLLGGSFDPPHLGHRALAEAALTHLLLDELWWLPAGQPWQKADRTLAPAQHRLQMLRLLVQGLPRCRIDERELHRPGLTYTVDTVCELQAERPDVEWVLVIGQDQLARLHTWVRWEQIVDRVTLAVAARDGQPPQADPQVRARATRLLALPMAPVAVSATQVRAALVSRQCEGLSALVGDAVAGYIECHHLYRGLSPT